MTPFRLILLTICLGSFAAILVGDREEAMDEASVPRLEFQMRSSMPGRGQMLVDYGDGHNEKDSANFTVRAGEAYHQYSIPFPRETGTIRNIRLDPIDQAADLIIRNPRIVQPKGPTRDLPPSRFKAIQDVMPVSIVGTDLHLTVPQTARDPILLIEETLGDSDGLAGSGRRERSSSVMTRWQLGCVVLAFLCLNLLVFPGAAKTLAIAVSRSYAASSTVRIVTCAVAGAVVASYAVIFFDMSVVSPPLIGSLYSRAPWVPGFEPGGEIETISGLDVGASFWTTLPNTAAQYEALFVCHEFPFWNRYVGGGIPLYAQGQSMIGDPIHLLCVLFKGSSWVWDAKIILEKCLFAVGVGILVRNLTASATSGMLLAIAANFLGFHIWRLNHPALFVITYCPWLLLAWMQLGAFAIEKQARWSKGAGVALTVAILAFIQINSGATKEAVITSGFTNALGMTLFALRLSGTYSWRYIVPVGSLAGFTVVCFTAPYWLLFIDALSKSYTVYKPVANTLRGHSPLLFFEPFFMTPIGSLMSFANMPVLLAAAMGFVGLWWHRSAAKIAVVGTASAALGVAFGVIPESVLVRMPLIRSINHIGNTFSVAATTPVLLLAGYGVAEFIAQSRQGRRWQVLGAGAVIGLLLLHWAAVISLSESAHLDDHGRLEGFAAIVLLGGVIAAAVGLWGALLFSVSRPWATWPRWTTAICAALLLLRFAVHPMTGVPRLDAGRRVVNAYPRVDYGVKSEAVEFTKRQQLANDGPSRVIGEGTVLFPGFNIRYLLEGVVPVEPLRSGFMDQLLDVLDYPDMGWGWLKLIASSQLESRALILDMLNVGFVLSMPDVQVPASLELACSADLNVWKRPSAWPRAFFTTTIIPVTSDAAFADFAKSTPPPFALVAADDASKLVKTTPGRSRPAREYLLTTNSSSFTVDADGPGIIVIHENYYPDDFVARLNGRLVDYIKVNGSFKGIPVLGAGTYRVSFLYRPAKLDVAIGLALLGFGICLSGPALATKRRSPQSRVSHLVAGAPVMYATPLSTSGEIAGVIEGPCEVHRHGTIESLLPAEFDVTFYRANNQDLAQLNDDDLARHYETHGHVEGRLASAGQSRGLHIDLFSEGFDSLEIGPFDCPLLAGPRVRYFDVMGQSELIARAASLGRHHGRTPPIDYVSESGDLAIVGDSLFDVVLSAHVVEHQPDLIGHFSHVARVLRPGGVYVAIIPDKRYCFDHFIRETAIADIVDASNRSARFHSLKSVVEHRALTCHNDCVRHWNGDHGSPVVSPDAVRQAVEEYQDAMGGYVDVHAWQFYPKQFRHLMQLLIDLRLLSLRPIRVYETLYGSNEFVAVLERSLDTE